MSLRYIVDGYNIINHPSFSRANRNTCPQTALLNFIKKEGLAGSHKNKITVVFDGYPPSENPVCGADGINSIFSRKISADEKIKQLVEETANRKNITVVSDDKEIRFAVRSLGASLLGAEEFINSKRKLYQDGDSSKPEINYSQMHKINQELRKIWLK